MNKTQATKFRRHLRAIDDAINKAFEGLSDLDNEDRKIFAKPLGELSCCLHFKMLDLIYAQHPELRPPDPPRAINSKLRWKDVKLPKSVSVADLDAIIFSGLTPQRQKTARVIGRAMNYCREHNLPISDEIVGARIEALGRLGRIERFGDLRFWGHSEVKLKD
jgi:hypothetical protein